MTNDFPSPDRHARGWRLISGDAHSDRPWIDAGDVDPPLFLARDANGDWWAVSAVCRQCAAPLLDALGEDTTRTGFDELVCAQCGAAHGPAVVDCDCLALMVVDEEIYVAPDVSAYDGAD